MLAIEKLSYCYENKEQRYQALKNISLSFQKPAIVALLGHNGCGKSTLLKMLGSSLPCKDGAISMFGRPALDSTGFINPSLRQKIGVLFQSTSSDVNLSARENLVFFARLMGLSSQALMRAVDECLAQASLGEKALAKLKTYSEGMRRRLEIYRTFLHQPKILLLDEPTEGLDFNESGRFFEFLKNYVKSKQALVLLATHRADELEHCHEIIMMNQGEIIAQHSPQELLKSCDYLNIEVELLSPTDALQSLGFVSKLKNSNCMEAKISPKDLSALLANPLLKSESVKSLRFQRPHIGDVYASRTTKSFYEQ